MATVELSPWITIHGNLPDPSDRSRTQYSLGTLFLVMTFVATALAVMRLVPALGVAVLLAAVPALFRTAVVWQRRYRGGLMPVVARIREFLLGLFAVIGFAVAIMMGVLTVFLATNALPFWAAAACGLTLILAVTLGCGDGRRRNTASGAR